ncbi:MAG TPA: anaerobic ribonucleoside-triphosphate reductase activating protein [Geopsychrobacteraceae bacterium]|nr:anaerobic ribonucleoside-triphosphate reductase activating protein [Geopsychrobacteraceae bacterium]
MRIKGFQGTSLLDFPGRLAALVFTGGCNLTCPFCHNPGLVLNPGQYPDYPIDELLVDLRQRSGFIDGVVVSGGEPTLEPGLEGFLSEVKQMGLQVKLDSNGLLPDVLQRLLGRDLIDYLAIDLKTSPNRYSELHNHAIESGPLLKTISLAKSAGCEYEFRTTCVPGLVDADDIKAIGKAIKGARLWVLQQFAPHHSLDETLRDVEPHSSQTLRSLSTLAADYAAEIKVRGDTH